MASPTASEIREVALTEGQRRHFTVLLAVLEETLHDVEAISAGRSRSGELVRAEHDLPPGFVEAMRPYTARIRERIRALADGLDVESRKLSDARRTQALLLTSVVRLEDSAADKLRAYGQVDPRVARVIGPLIADLHAAFGSLLALLNAQR
jgi:hypothetical protein